MIPAISPVPDFAQLEAGHGRKMLCSAPPRSAPPNAHLQPGRAVSVLGERLAFSFVHNPVEVVTGDELYVFKVALKRSRRFTGGAVLVAGFLRSGFCA